MNSILSTTGRDQIRWCVKPWILRRENLAASSTLLIEWPEENPEVYRNNLGMNEGQFAYLLENVTPFIKKYILGSEKR